MERDDFGRFAKGKSPAPPRGHGDDRSVRKGPTNSEAGWERGASRRPSRGDADESGPRPNARWGIPDQGDLERERAAADRRGNYIKEFYIPVDGDRIRIFPPPPPGPTGERRPYAWYAKFYRHYNAGLPYSICPGLWWDRDADVRKKVGDCAVCRHAKVLWRRPDAQKEAIGISPKLRYLFNGTVRNPDKSDEIQVELIEVPSTLGDLILDEIRDVGVVEFLDPETGREFKIRVTKRGGYNDYGLSRAAAQPSQILIEGWEDRLRDLDEVLKEVTIDLDSFNAQFDPAEVRVAGYAQEEFVDNGDTAEPRKRRSWDYGEDNDRTPERTERERERLGLGNRQRERQTPSPAPEEVPSHSRSLRPSRPFALPAKDREASEDEDLLKDKDSGEEDDYEPPPPKQGGGARRR